MEFRLQDYRGVDERFDRVASVGMFEHVGRKNHREFMRVAHRCLARDGLFLLHTIGKNQRDSSTDPWVDRYIFPNGELPSCGQIGDAAAFPSSAMPAQTSSQSMATMAVSWHCLASN